MMRASLLRLSPLFLLAAALVALAVVFVHEVTGTVAAADIADRALFEVDQNGAHGFKTPHSYEVDPASGDKQYRVSAQFPDGYQPEYFAAYAGVLDVELTEKVSFGLSGTGDASISVPLPENVEWQQFQPGAGPEARVTDPNVDTRDYVVPRANVTWKWYRATPRSAVIPIAPTPNTVVAADVGHRIKVEATYNDGSGPDETVSYTSPNPVQRYRDPKVNRVPKFAPDAATFRVWENSRGNIGGPATANDPDGDILTYAPSAWNTPVTFTVSGDDDDSNDETVAITHRVTSQDPNYHNIAVSTVRMEVSDTTAPEQQGGGETEDNKYADLIAKVKQWRDDPCCAHNKEHTDRWDRVLKTFGETVADSTLTIMTASEAQGYANRGWNRWVEVAQALRELENQAPTVASAIADATIVNESGTLEVSLAGVFNDADSDA